MNMVIQWGMNCSVLGVGVKDHRRDITGTYTKIYGLYLMSAVRGSSAR